MYNFIERSNGQNNLARLQEYFVELKYTINAGKATIDMVVFDTTARTAYLSRGESCGLDWGSQGVNITLNITSMTTHA